MTLTASPAITPKPIPGGPVLEDHRRLPLATYVREGTVRTYETFDFAPAVNGVQYAAPSYSEESHSFDVVAGSTRFGDSIEGALVPVSGGFDDALRAARDLINTGSMQLAAVVAPAPDRFAILRAQDSTKPTSTTQIKSWHGEVEQIPASVSRTRTSGMEMTRIAPGSAFVRALVTPEGYYDLRGGALEAAADGAALVPSAA